MQSYLGLLLVATIWGITNPLIKRGSMVLQSSRKNPDEIENGIKSRWTIRFINDWILLLKTPSYFIPWIMNLMGSILYYIVQSQTGRLHLHNIFIETCK